MQIKIKKLREDAVLPYYATDGSSGMDLTATSQNIVSEEGYGYVEYGTGLAIQLPKDHSGLIFPRSSISKTGMILANSVGLIDPDYTGEIKLRFKYIAGTTYYSVGDKIGQLVVVKTPHVTFKEVNELEETQRGDKGFGHTDDLIY